MVQTILGRKLNIESWELFVWTMAIGMGMNETLCEDGNSKTVVGRILGSSLT